MRVITGRAKGKPLKAVSGMTTRPTTDRVKESLFAIIGAMVDGCRFLDLFAGTGAIGIEAVSRGASSAIFIDFDQKSVDVIKKNISACKFDEETKIYRNDVFRAIDILHKKGEIYDIVFCDPPYSKGLAQRTVDKLSQKPVFADGAWLIVEHNRRDPINSSSDRLKLFRREDYGETSMSFFVYGCPEGEEA